MFNESYLFLKCVCVRQQLTRVVLLVAASASWAALARIGRFGDSDPWARRAREQLGPQCPAEAHMKSAVTPPGPRWGISWGPCGPSRPRGAPQWAPPGLFNNVAHQAQEHLFFGAFASFQRPKKV